MNTTVSILMKVDLSEGADNTPELKGIYRSNMIARDKAMCILCVCAAEWDVPWESIDMDNLRIADSTGTRCIQLGINEADLSCEAKFEVI